MKLIAVSYCKLSRGRREALLIKKIAPIILFLFFQGCGGREPSSPQEKSKIQQTVEQAVTKELKMYEGAKQSLEKMEKEAQKQQKEAALK